MWIDEPDSLGRTALSWAAWRGEELAVQTLLQYGASASICTPTELSALHRAIEGGSFRCVELLLEHGADVNHKNKRGRTPLHYSCRLVDGTEITKLLLRWGADVNAEDHGQACPLHELIAYNRIEQFDLLLEVDCNLDHPTADGTTPLFLAIDRNNPLFVERLLAAGADPRITTNGVGLLHIAASRGSADVLRTIGNFDIRCLDASIANDDGLTAQELFNHRDDISQELQEAFSRLLESLIKHDGNMGELSMTGSEDTELHERYYDAIDYQLPFI